ncbi:MAG: hypothetical protein M3552_17865, partial [Planctomycetota bacterium]|nr:hypothetical protein [Planctomycetota bacterium]
MVRRVRGDAFAAGSIVTCVAIGLSAVAEENAALQAAPRPQKVSATEVPRQSSYESESRDAIDASAPLDPKAGAKRLQQAESLIAAGRVDRALDVLLYTLDQADGAMVRRSDGRLSAVTVEVNRLLGTLPQQTLDLYRRQYGGAAEKALHEAVASSRRDLIERVAVQFRHTEAGKAAIRHLAAIHFDRGEFGLAARRYAELLDDGLDPGSRLRA